MITKEQLAIEGWAENLTESFHKGRMEKKIGRVTYSCWIHKTLFIGVFVPQKLEDLWSMSMSAPLFSGDCPDIETFHLIFNLVAKY